MEVLLDEFSTAIIGRYYTVIVVTTYGTQGDGGVTR